MCAAVGSGQFLIPENVEIVAVGTSIDLPLKRSSETLIISIP
ncbi:MAG: hypothetical protein ACI8XC_003957 [Gammaproteobacteria bacterium]|jgi:hypothetical protein